MLLLSLFLLGLRQEHCRCGWERIRRGRCARVGSAEDKERLQHAGLGDSRPASGLGAGGEHGASRVGLESKHSRQNVRGVCSHRTQKSLVDLIHSVTGPFSRYKPHGANSLAEASVCPEREGRALLCYSRSIWARPPEHRGAQERSLQEERQKTAPDNVAFMSASCCLEKSGVYFSKLWEQ